MDAEQIVRLLLRQRAMVCIPSDEAVPHGRDRWKCGLCGAWWRTEAESTFPEHHTEDCAWRAAWDYTTGRGG